MVTDGSQIYGGDHFLVYTDIEPLCYTPETDMVIKRKEDVRFK